MSTDSADSVYPWLLAWAVFAVVVMLLNRTRLGHVVIYYVLVLAVLVLLVTQFSWFQAALAPLHNLPDAVSGKTSTASATPATAATQGA